MEIESGPLPYFAIFTSSNPPLAADLLALNVSTAFGKDTETLYKTYSLRCSRGEQVQRNPPDAVDPLLPGTHSRCVAKGWGGTAIPEVRTVIGLPQPFIQRLDFVW